MATRRLSRILVKVLCIRFSPVARNLPIPTRTKVGIEIFPFTKRLSRWLEIRGSVAETEIPVRDSFLDPRAEEGHRAAGIYRRLEPKRFRERFKVYRGPIGSDGGEKSYRMAIATRPRSPATGFCRCNRAERVRCTRLCPRGCRLAVSWESRCVCTVVLEAVTLPCIAALL